MEQEKKPIQFTNINSDKKPQQVGNSPVKESKKDSVGAVASKRSSSSKSPPIKINANHLVHKIENNVSVILVKDLEEDYSTIKTIHDVLELDKKKPNNIVGLLPAIYYEFIDRANKTINTFVKVGDLVTVNRKFMDKKGDIPRQVKKVYSKSLNNMTVILAELDDKEVYLTNRLIVCK